MKIFDKILENVKPGNFKFGFSAELLEKDDFKLACQAGSYFQFKKTPEIKENGETESKDQENKQETAHSPKTRGFDPFASIDGPHKRQQSHFSYVNDPLSIVLAQPIPSVAAQTQLSRAYSPPRMADPILSQQLATAQSASQFKTATPPPPGMYLSHAHYDLQRR